MLNHTNYECKRDAQVISAIAMVQKMLDVQYIIIYYIHCGMNKNPKWFNMVHDAPVLTEAHIEGNVLVLPSLAVRNIRPLSLHTIINAILGLYCLYLSAIQHHPCSPAQHWKATALRAFCTVAA